jgi:hypothetical protein
MVYSDMKEKTGLAENGGLPSSYDIGDRQRWQHAAALALILAVTL